MRKRGWGYRLEDGTCISLLLYADNFWLASTSAGALGLMTNACLHILAEHGWTVPMKEAVWCHTAATPSTKWRVHTAGEDVKMSPRHEGFKALGVQISFNGGLVKGSSCLLHWFLIPFSGAQAAGI